MFKKLLTIVCAAALIGFASYAYASSLPLGGETYYLAGAGINATQNTIQLTYFITPDGTPVTMSELGTIGYGALESQTTSKIEDVSFTGITQNANGTATLTGVTRGVGFFYPYASSATLMKSHAGGSTFIITNTPEFYYNEFAMQNNNNVFTYPTASTSPATKGYVDSIAFSGAGAIPATTIAQGYVQLATGQQAASSTGVGSTGANLVLTSAIATSTYNAATAPLKVVVTNNAGTIDPNFLNLGSYTGPSPAFASSTVIGSTNALAIGKNEVAFNTSGTWTVPNGITKVYARIVGGGGSGGSFNVCGSAGGSGGYAEGILSVSGTLSYTIGTGGAGVSSSQSGNGGTATSVGGLTANGGGGGSGSGSTGVAVQGGGGGAASGGTVNSTGTTGNICVAGSSGSVNGAITPSVLGNSYGYGSAGATSGSSAGGSGELVIMY